MKARGGGAEQDGRGLRDLISGQLTQAIENAADERGLQSGTGCGRRLRAEGAAEFLFNIVIEQMCIRDSPGVAWPRCSGRGQR